MTPANMRTCATCHESPVSVRDELIRAGILITASVLMAVVMAVIQRILTPAPVTADH